MELMLIVLISLRGDRIRHRCRTVPRRACYQTANIVFFLLVVNEKGRDGSRITIHWEFISFVYNRSGSFIVVFSVRFFRIPIPDSRESTFDARARRGVTSP